MLVEMFTNSKSGSFFFYSADFRFILKTCTKREAAFLMAALPQYHQHLMQNRCTSWNESLVQQQRTQAWPIHECLRRSSVQSLLWPPMSSSELATNTRVPLFHHQVHTPVAHLWSSPCASEHAGPPLAQTRLP